MESALEATAPEISSVSKENASALPDLSRTGRYVGIVPRTASVVPVESVQRMASVSLKTVDQECVIPLRETV